MKKTFAFFLLSFCCIILAVQSCDHNDTYADLRKKERRQVQNFLKKGIEKSQAEKYNLNVPIPIHVITENEFFKNDSTTNLEKNEYVLFKNSGVYMQIVRKGAGEKLQKGETTTLLCRYTEYNIAVDSVESTNNFSGTEAFPDVMTVSNELGNISGTFIKGTMTATYKSTVVPAGWLIPLRYINIGRQNSADQEIAKVRLIVPSTQGQERANTKTYSCFYELTYQRAR